mgnify:CR=1 FL=1
MSSTSPSPNIAGPSGEPVNGGPGVGAAPAPLWVDALGDSGALLGSVRVSHGEHPEAALARAGWAAIDVLAADLGPSQGVVLRYAARHLPAASAFASGAPGAADHALAQHCSGRPRAVDRGLVLAPGELPQPRDGTPAARCADHGGGHPGILEGRPERSLAEGAHHRAMGRVDRRGEQPVQEVLAA